MLLFAAETQPTADSCLCLCDGEMWMRVNLETREFNLTEAQLLPLSSVIRASDGTTKSCSEDLRHHSVQLC